MAKFAGKVPFSLEEIQQGAGVLSVVSKDASELAKIMEITGNVAAVSGLDFRTASEQIQRSLSAGINAADLFRERGVREMLGFKAGATVSIEETRDALIKVFGPNGEFAGATDDLANTLQGTLSMIGDKYFNFQKQVAEEFFDELKSEFGAFDQALQENEAIVSKVAKAVGKFLGDAIIKASNALKFFVENIKVFKALGLGLVAFKITQGFIALGTALAVASANMVAFTTLFKRTFVGVLVSAGVALASFSGLLNNVFNSKKEDDIQTYTSRLATLNVQLLGVKDTLQKTNTDDFLTDFQKISEAGHSILKNIEPLKEELRQDISALKDLEKIMGEIIKLGQSPDDEFFNIEVLQKFGIKTFEDFQDAIILAEADLLNLDQQTAQFIETLRNVPFGEILLGFENTSEEISFLTDSMKKFREGFKEAMDKDVFTSFEKAGATAFKSLKKMLTDFVITGKMNMNDFKRAVSTAIIEALIGKAVSAAIERATDLFKLETIKKALMSVYEGALKTFASIPFPFNIAATGAAIGFGMNLVNKIRGFADGGRPSPGQVALVGERGPELFVPDSAGTVVPNHKLSGETNVNITINANDTEGFDDLLVKRRSLIVNVINDALNSQGREALI